MAAEAITYNGSTISIAPAQATTPANAAAYAALTWTAIGLVTKLPPYGDTASVQTISVIGDGRDRDSKGSRNAGGGEMTVLPKASDAGQAALEAAEATNGYYPIRVVKPNRLDAGGTDGIDYFMALVTSKNEPGGGNNDFITINYSLKVTSAITRVAPTAAP